MPSGNARDMRLKYEEDANASECEKHLSEEGDEEADTGCVLVDGEFGGDADIEALSPANDMRQIRIFQLNITRIQIE